MARAEVARAEVAKMVAIMMTVVGVWMCGEMINGQMVDVPLHRPWSPSERPGAPIDCDFFCDSLS